MTALWQALAWFGFDFAKRKIEEAEKERDAKEEALRRHAHEVREAADAAAVEDRAKDPPK